MRCFIIALPAKRVAKQEASTFALLNRVFGELKLSDQPLRLLANVVLLLGVARILLDLVLHDVCLLAPFLDTHLVCDLGIIVSCQRWKQREIHNDGARLHEAALVLGGHLLRRNRHCFVRKRDIRMLWRHGSMNVKRVTNQRRAHQLVGNSVLAVCCGRTGGAGKCLEQFVGHLTVPVRCVCARVSCFGGGSVKQVGRLTVPVCDFCWWQVSMRFMTPTHRPKQ